MLAWKAENNPEADTERKSLLKELDPKGFPFVDSPNRGVPSWEIRRLGRGREPTVSFLRKQESRKNRPNSGNFFVGANRHPTAYNKKSSCSKTNLGAGMCSVFTGRNPIIGGWLWDWPPTRWGFLAGWIQSKETCIPPRKRGSLSIKSRAGIFPTLG